MTQTTYTRADLIGECIQWHSTANTEAMKEFVSALIDRLRDDAEYKCVGGHDLCQTMSPGRECPTCEMRP